MRNWQGIIEDESGATAVEYGLIAAIIAVSAAGAMFSLGNGVQDKFDQVDSAVAEASSGN